ncbi:hypothetical protein JZG80_01540 [Staphylococcus saprophyticus]|nr:hypothetical protein [Staphylococcus saprophyticus]MBN6095414.1 hypothetical protein [Staphylococcus saprophyticus]MBN6098012.1 hypothetical protein [Staphylococcus saprophyticus]MBN6098884.1 hypothetical protein [Staphylococcus saprophyticus]RXS03977.1 hypothetical protein EUA49_03570 [Staphylococcus saprophyticus]
MNNKNNIEITTQNDIDKYIELLIQKAEKEIELLFARRLKIIKQEINDMFEKYQADSPHVTWTEFNKYNRLNKELTRIGTMLTNDYREVAKAIQKSQADAYIEKFLMSLYLYEMASQIPMQIDVPSPEVILRAIEQPIEFIKLIPTLEKHRENVLRKIRMNITQGIMSGEGYSKIAKSLRDDIGMTKAQSMRVARTEAGRAMSQAGLDSAKVAQKNGLDMKKRWFATKDTRTRVTHRDLDGVSLLLDEQFHSSGCVGSAPKLFVGIKSASENIACRCKLFYYIDEDELPTTMRVRNDDGSTSIEPLQTYNEWKESKIKKAQKEKPKQYVKKNIDYSQIKEPDNKKSVKVVNDGTNYIDQLPKNIQKSISDYTTPKAEFINGFLKGEFNGQSTPVHQNPSAYSSVFEDIRNLNSAISNYKIPEDFITYRGISLEELKAIYKNLIKDDNGKLIGIGIGFKSTSRHIDTTQYFGDGWKMICKIPKGANALSIENYSNLKMEEEILLNHGVKFYIENLDEDMKELSVNIIVEELQ